jgi:hypothetical protein
MQDLRSQGINQGYRPVYTNKVALSREEIKSSDQLISAFKNSATGKNITLDGPVPPAFLYALAQSSPAGKRIMYGTVEYRGSYIYKQ